MSETAFPMLDAVEDVFKRLVWDNSVRAAKLALYANPYTKWLGIWPIKPVFEFAIDQFSEKMFSVTKLVVDLAAIRFKNAEKQRAYENSSVKLYILARSYGLNSEQYKVQREIDHEAFAKFIRFGAAA